MIVQRGITGFFNWDERGPIPEFSFDEFKRIVFSVASPLGFEVSNVTKRGVTPNFHSALINYEDDTVAILGHAIYPIFAFAEPLEPHSSSLLFIDSEPFSQKMTSLFPKVTVATSLELNRKLADTDFSKLDVVELDEIKFWKPQCVGDLAFNWWD